MKIQNRKTAKKNRLWCRSVMLSGSMTIEAAVVTVVSMIILLVIIFLGFYVNNKAAMSAVDYYSALEYADKALSGSQSVNSISSRLEKSLYGASGINAGVSGGDDIYTAWSDASFNIPFPMAGQMLDPGIQQLHADVQISFLQGRKRLLYYRSICSNVPELLKRSERSQ